jgi:hypothetical protein
MALKTNLFHNHFERPVAHQNIQRRSTEKILQTQIARSQTIDPVFLKGNKNEHAQGF